MQKNVAVSVLLFLFLPLAVLGLPGWASSVNNGQDLAAAGHGPLLQTVSSQGFSLKAEVSGEISYFAGQTNQAGRKIPLDNKRFLGGELVRFKLEFSSWPASFRIDLGGQVQQFNGINGRTYYELTLPLSDLAETLAWDGKRQNPSWTLTVTAWSGSTPQQQVSCQFTDLELTGDIWQLVQVQPVQP